MICIAVAATAAVIEAATGTGPGFPPEGDVEAVYGIVERLFGPEALNNFTFSKSSVPGCELPDSTSENCANVVASNGKVAIVGSGANEISAGLGFYLRDVCNLTIGWPRGGGSDVHIPPGGWPEAMFSRERVVPWSYGMNVCTHSYSFVWYGWKEWEDLLDWMALG